MTGAWEIPTSLNVGGAEYKIRSDYRAILDILKFFNDPEYDQEEKWEICLDILYEDFESMPRKDWQEAEEKAAEFIDMGIKDDGKKRPHTMDWEQDAAIIIPPINRVLGKEIRLLPYLHWWTFLGAYMEIGESLFSQVLNIRNKKAKNKRLEKWEADFYAENKRLVDLNVKTVKRSEEEKNELRELFGFKK